jgi:hypothetical protein
MARHWFRKVLDESELLKIVACNAFSVIFCWQRSRAAESDTMQLGTLAQGAVLHAASLYLEVRTRPDIGQCELRCSGTSLRWQAGSCGAALVLRRSCSAWFISPSGCCTSIHRWC